MQIKLVSIAGCPFVQRTVVLLREKQISYEAQSVDLKNKPDWFLAISPFGRVPVLVADGTPLFESAAIMEFLEETHPEPPIYPRDPILRARDRGWLSGAPEEFYKPMGMMVREPSRNAEARATLDARLTRLDHELGKNGWLSFGGAAFGMAEIAVAPFVSRLDLYEQSGLYSIPAGLSRFTLWRERLCARASVAGSLPPETREVLKRFVSAAAQGANAHP